MIDAMPDDTSEVDASDSVSASNWVNLGVVIRCTCY